MVTSKGWGCIIFNMHSWQPQHVCFYSSAITITLSEIYIVHTVLANISNLLVGSIVRDEPSISGWLNPT